MSLENAKKLLRKAIELEDEELIDMASQALSAVYGQRDSEDIKSTEPEPVKNDPLDKHVMPNITKDIFNENKADTDGDCIFKIRDENDKSSNRGGIPVNEVKNRFNSFTDDGTEGKDIKTPAVEMTERRRPAFKTIEQVCKKCSSIVKVHPSHKRDFFVCDKCVPK